MPMQKKLFFYMPMQNKTLFLHANAKKNFFAKREGISLKFASEYTPNYIKHLERKSTSKQDPKGAICKYPFL
jgi:hypothetical protein